MYLRSLLALNLLTAPALVQDHTRTDLVRGLCQKHGFGELRILMVEPVRSDADGSLKRLRVQTFHASYSGRETRGEGTSYVYCSLTKPAVVVQKGERTVDLLLAPFATEDTCETVRRYTTFSAIYFAGCHGLEAGRNTARDLRATAQAFGYRVPATCAQAVSLNRAEDILGPPATAAALPAATATPAPKPFPATPSQKREANVAPLPPE